MFTLRPYQSETADKAVSFMVGDEPGNGLVVMPTGAGKSLIIAEVVRRLPGPCIVFQPTKHFCLHKVAQKSMTQSALVRLRKAHEY